MDDGQAAVDEDAMLQPGDVIKRHRLSTRIWHWTNALTLLVLLMSGLMIFNAHPRLYWGQYGANDDAAWLVIDDAGDTGFIELAGLRVETTGVLGIWENAEGEIDRRAFPYWITIPSGYDLETGRRWHFFFAWIFALALTAYMVRSAWNGHIKRDLHIRHREWSPKHIWHDIKDHARLRFPTGSTAKDYNILQKISYISIIFILLPLMIFTGLSMSPAMNAAWPWLLDIFGGRQSARSIHFICAFGLVMFFLVHIIMVALAGPINEVRSMITGRYRLPGKHESGPEIPQGEVA
ncbi:MAG: cytochrome b/b6 domain-containing protein [Sphingorhabdus sp.]